MSSRGIVLVFAITVVGAARARAQQPSAPPVVTPPAAPPAQPTGQPIQYAAIDRASVRVFALSTVDVVQTPVISGVRRWVAIPDAGHGSGVVVSADGLVLTAAHVVAGARLIAVGLPGASSPLPARVVYVDAQRDFAFLAVGGEHGNFVPLPETPPTLHVRETVAAIGYPIDADRPDPQSTSGIVAGLLPSGEIQLGMSLNPGNSGGPLVNASEQIVGIVVARADPRTGVQGIGMAVPLAPILAGLRDHVLARGLLSSARTDLARSAEADLGVARAVSMLVRVGLRGVGREIAQLVDMGHAELVSLLRAIPADRVSADVGALRAALLWDALVVLLERNRAPSPRELPFGRERELGLAWEQEAIASVHAAVRSDPELPRRSPFAAFMVRFWPLPVAPPPGRPTMPRAPGVRDDEAPGLVPPATEEDEGPSRLGVRATLSIPQAMRVETVEPGGVLLGGGLSWIATESRATVSVAAVLGADVVLGSWSGDFAALLGGSLGARVGFGDLPRGRYWARVDWTPSIVQTGSHTTGSAVALRAAVGVMVGPVSVGLSWRTMGLAEAYSLHAIELGAGIGY